jgi:hypothetical protein
MVIGVDCSDRAAGFGWELKGEHGAIDSKTRTVRWFEHYWCSHVDQISGWMSSNEQIRQRVL